MPRLVHAGMHRAAISIQSFFVVLSLCHINLRKKIKFDIIFEDRQRWNFEEMLSWLQKLRNLKRERKKIEERRHRKRVEKKNGCFGILFFNELILCCSQVPALCDF